MEYWTTKQIIAEHGTPEEFREFLEAEKYIKSRIGQLVRREHSNDSWADEEIQVLIQFAGLLRRWRAAKYDKRYLPC